MAPNIDSICEWIKINRKFSPISALERLGLVIKRTERGYSNAELLYPIVLATLTNSTLEAVSEALRKVFPGTASADTVLRHIRKFDLDKIEKMINRALAESFRAAWIPSMKALVAVDMTDIYYYGNLEGTDAKHTRPRRGTHYAYRFMVASIVSEKGKFVLHVRLVRRNEDLKTALRKVLEKVRRLVRISWLILDKGFFQVRIIRMLKRMKISFVIAVPRRENLDELASRGSFVIRYAVTSKKYGKEIVYIVGFTDEKGVVYYATNKLIKRKRCGDMHRRYKKRWRIEVSFAVIKRAVAKTTSKSSSVRLFLFAISCILYNLWILTNFSWTSRHSKSCMVAPETGKRYVHWLIRVIVIIIAMYLARQSRLRLNNCTK